ncbi:MAG: GGDEF domain-containing protein [Pseudorhodoferax sp.]
MSTYALDPRTTVLIGSITSGLMAIVLWLLARATPLPVPGLRTWVVGAWMVFIAMVLLGLRDWITPLASVMLGNSALVLAYIVWLAGTHRHLGARLRWGPWLLAWAVMVAAVTWFVYGDASFRARSVIVAGLCSAIGAYHALVLLRSPQTERFGRSLGITLTGSWLVILTAVYAVRAVHAALFAQGTSGLLTQDTVQIVYTGSFTVCNLLLVIGFATMASDHVRARIEEQAIRDPLTGTLNRQALLECLERERAHHGRTGQPFCVAMLDVDHFKKINDSHGHPVGDRVLVHMCRRMAVLVRPYDVVARYGGEEFIVVMPQTRLTEAALVAERLLVEAVQADGLALPSFTVSIGLAEWSTDDATEQDVIARADAALYLAKARGRNRLESAALRLVNA